MAWVETLTGMNQFMRRGRGMWMVAALFICAAGAGAEVPDLQVYKSRSYEIHTDLSRDEVREFGRHMDVVFAQYEDRFREFHSRGRREMPLYLLRTEQEYHDFMSTMDIDATNSGGMFFFSPKGQGLATWTEGRSRSQTFEVLQHEGFHQFAFNYIGKQLPTWTNEGLAQYFEDAIIVGDRMVTGLANARRVEQVRQAIIDHKTIDVRELVGMSNEDWSATLRGDVDKASLLYAESWSIVYFLIHGEDERYQPAFAQYLMKVGQGRDSRTAFTDAFGTSSYDGLASKWRAFAITQKPDPINQAAARMEFLGEALRYLYTHEQPMPRTLSQLRNTLQARRFVLTRRSHGVVTQIDATDSELYHYAKSNGAAGQFKLLEPARDDLPPRITADGLHPEPTLVWSRDENGKLVQDIEYR